MTQNERRELWTKVHRYLGLASMLFLGSAALTGMLLAYADPIDRALNSDLFQATSQTSSPAAPLADRFVSQHPDFTITSFPVAVQPGRNLAISGFDRNDPKHASKQVFVDVGTGAIVGERRLGPAFSRRGIVEAIREFHFTLLGGTAGRWWMGLMAVAWLLSVPVGVYLTWPRKAPWLKNWRRSWKVSLRSVFGRLMLDLHKASGLWLLFGVALLALTSVCLNFNSELFEPFVEHVFPPNVHAAATAGPGPIHDFEGALRAGVRQAQLEGIDWQPATLSYDPERAVYGVEFTDNGTPNYHYLGPVKLFIRAGDGGDAGRADPYADGTASWLERVIFPIHSGQIGGQVTVFLVFLVGLATLEMCVTGAYVWWKKRQGRVAARKAKQRSSKAATQGAQR